MTKFAANTQAIHATIKQILLLEWDPIGISEYPEAQDEYDSYITDVYRLLATRVSTQELFDYLWKLETQHMGLSGDRERTARIAKRLSAIFANADDI